MYASFNTEFAIFDAPSRCFRYDYFHFASDRAMIRLLALTRRILTPRLPAMPLFSTRHSSRFAHAIAEKPDFIATIRNY
jgi:hypothetical protein